MKGEGGCRVALGAVTPPHLSPATAWVGGLGEVQSRKIWLRDRGGWEAGKEMGGTCNN
jgi:hypothetical protein